MTKSDMTKQNTENVQFVDKSDNDSIAQFVAALIQKSSDRNNGDNFINIAVPGGSTPFPIFDILATLDVPLERVTFWMTDDRIVAEDHPASNIGRVKKAFEGSKAQMKALSLDADMPHFDLVWLGMGEDGHIASLFPNIDPDPHAEQAVIRLTPDPLPPEAPFDRISLTMPALVNCDQMMLVLRGEKKKNILNGAIAGEHDLPIARLLRQANSPVTIFWSAS